MDKVNMGEWESRLINELVQGRELARRLQMCLHSPSSSPETCEFLIQRIIAAFEKALATVNWNGDASHLTRVGIVPTSESPPFSGSPRSEDSDRDFQDQSASKKRRSMPRWTKQIRVSPGMGVEGTLDDGYSWRKYGQKEILGAKFPRGYYRCTHRNVQGCLATKQVQRSDEDPNVFEITYRGTHTCSQSSNAVAPSGTQESHELNPNAVDPQQHSQEQLLLNLRAGLRVQTDNLDVPAPEQSSSFTSLIFGSTSSIMDHENRMFTSSMLENNFADNLTSDPSYMSPATSGITSFSVSPSGGVNNMFGEMPNMATTSGSEINDIVSAVTSAANSPTVGLNLPFDQFGYDGHSFTFDNQRFF
ncbi:probable WRKY transcription factor 30 [Neltuma alba]|uniref:probable WRKY transcription factor 30 n=1 Tax=Neltuma alba TaxID=207710 RepID=UPI0010A35949|nr:probable WRKY transcription factor 30 [Prosopis alba]